MLRPLRLYDVDEGFGADELAAEGEALDAVLEKLEKAEGEMLIPTAMDGGLSMYEGLLPYVPSYVTLNDRRQAIMALLRVDDCSFTSDALNSTLSGCGIKAAAEENGTQTVTVSLTHAFPRNLW
jgi:hypothetical protein